ncbi:ADF1 [Candida metapsilosis]|uniref:ADF1 n=1 Tax=Candida metapsilosis TaxID=273372 RepID=A0A8H8DB27_9ASCO|nr:ADF1 [Candida metapsilosis]
MLPQPQSRSNSILQPQELQQQQRQQQQQQQQQQQNQQDLNQQQQSQIQQHLELQPDNTQQYSQHFNNLRPRQVSKLTPQAHSQPQAIPAQQKSTSNNFTNTSNFNPTNRPVQLSQHSQQRQLHQNSNQIFQNQYLTQQPTNSKPQQQQQQQPNQHSQFNQPFQQPSSHTYSVQSQLQYFQQMPPHNNQGQMPPSQQQQQQQHQQQQQQLHQQFSQHLQHPQPSFYDASNYMYQAIPSNYQPRPQLPLQQQQPSHQPEYYVPVKNPSVSSTSPTTSSSQKERKAKGAASAAAAASPVETHELVILPNFPERLQSILPHPPLSKAPVRPDITVSSTAKRAKRKSKFTPEQDDLIVSLKRKGKSWVEIAEITGVGSYLTARNRYQVIVGQQGNNNSSAWDNNDKIFLRNLLDPAEFEKWRYIASELNKSTNKNFNDFEVREMVRVLFWSNPASFGVSEESIKEALKEKKLTDKTIEQREQQRKKKLSNVVGIDEEHTGSSSNSGNAATTTGDQRNSYHDDHSKNQQASSNIYTKPF